jgi:hypothetical protein
MSKLFFASLVERSRGQVTSCSYGQGLSDRREFFGGNKRWMGYVASIEAVIFQVADDVLEHEATC